MKKILNICLVLFITLTGCVFADNAEEITETTSYNLDRFTNYKKEYKTEEMVVCSAGSFKSYMDYRAITSKSSNQYVYVHSNLAVDTESGLLYDSEGFIAVALGSKYGNIGDRFYITLSSGNILPVVKAEAKADTDTNNGCEQSVDKSVMEFVLDKNVAKEYFSDIWSTGDLGNNSYFSGSITKIEKVLNEKIKKEETEELTNYVAQIGDTKYETLTDAINAVENEATITLLMDTSEDVVIPTNKNITLDLNGKTLSGVNSDAVYVALDATLTITGGGSVLASTKNKAAVFNNGTTIINNGTYNRANNSTWYLIVNHGTMTINDGTFKNETSGDTSSLVENGYTSYPGSNERGNHVDGTNLSSPNLTIKAGSFDAGSGSNVVKNDDGGELTINGGNFKASQNQSGAIIQNWNKATINDGDFEASGRAAVVSNGALAGDVNKGELTIKDGNFSASGDGMVFSSGGGSNESAAITVDGGSYSGAVLVQPGNVSGVTINEGTFSTLDTGSNDKVSFAGATATDGTTNYVGNKTINNVIENTDTATTLTILNGSIDIETTNSNITIKNSENNKGTVSLNGDEITAGESEKVKETVKTPTVNVEEGTYYTEQTLKFSDETDEAKIYIEVFKNGQREYKGEAKDYILTSILGDSNTYTVKAYAVKEDMFNSKTIEPKYTIALPNKAGLETLINAYETKYTSTELAKYTDLTVKAYQEKLAAAKTVLAEESVSQSELNTASSQLTTTVNELKLKSTTDTKKDATSSTTSSSKTYDSRDKNHDGVVTCDEVNGIGWIWSEKQGKCIYKVVNTGTK